VIAKGKQDSGSARAIIQRVLKSARTAVFLRWMVTNVNGLIFAGIKYVILPCLQGNRWEKI